MLLEYLQDDDYIRKIDREIDREIDPLFTLCEGSIKIYVVHKGTSALK